MLAGEGAVGTVRKRNEGDPLAKSNRDTLDRSRMEREMMRTVLLAERKVWKARSAANPVYRVKTSVRRASRDGKV